MRCHLAHYGLVWTQLWTISIGSIGYIRTLWTPNVSHIPCVCEYLANDLTNVSPPGLSPHSLASCARPFESSSVNFLFFLFQPRDSTAARAVLDGGSRWRLSMVLIESFRMPNSSPRLWYTILTIIIQIQRKSSKYIVEESQRKP